MFTTAAWTWVSRAARWCLVVAGSESVVCESARRLTVLRLSTAGVSGARDHGLAVIFVKRDRLQLLNLPSLDGALGSFFYLCSDFG